MMPRAEKFLQVNIFLLRFTFALFLSLIAQVLQELQSHYALPVSQAGLFISFQSVGGIIFIFAGAFIFDRFDKRAVLLLAALFFVLLITLLANLPPLGFLYALLALIGCDNGTIDTMTNAITGEQRSGNRTLRFNLLHVFFGLGAIVGPYFAVTLQTGLGLQTMFRVFAGMVLLVVISYGSSLMMVKRQRSTHVEHQPAARQAIHLSRQEIGNLLKISAMTFLVASSTIIPLTWLSMFTSIQFGLPRSMGALALSLYWTGRVCGLLIYPRLVRHQGFWPPILLGALAAGIIFAAGLLLGNPVIYFFSILITGLLFANTEPQILLLAIHNFPDKPAFATSVYAVVASASVIIMPGLAGLIGESFGLTISLLMASLFMLILGLLSFRSSWWQPA